MLASCVFLWLAAQCPTLATAQVDIVPPEPLALGGYTERHWANFSPGGDELYARAEVWRDGGSTLAIVSVECLTIPDSLVSAVKERIPKSVELFLTATHTHCAPDSQMLNDRMTLSVPGIANFKRKWLAWYADRIGSCVNSALSASQTPVISLELFEAHPGANRGRRPLADPDDLLTQVEAITPSGPMGMIWHYAAHPVIYGPEETHLRGDWPGVIAAKYRTLVLIGAIGDVSPNADGPDSASRMASFLEKIANARLSGSTVVCPPDREYWVRVPIKLGTPTPQPTFAKTYGVPQQLAEIAVRQFAPTSASITAFRIGSMAVIGVPGEPTGDLGRRIRDEGKRIGFRSVLVVSHVNGWIGYILAPDDYDLGGYEATLALYGRDEGLRVVEAADSALKALARR